MVMGNVKKEARATNKIVSKPVSKFHRIMNLDILNFLTIAIKLLPPDNVYIIRTVI